MVLGQTAKEIGTITGRTTHQRVPSERRGFMMATSSTTSQLPWLPSTKSASSRGDDAATHLGWTQHITPLNLQPQHLPGASVFQKLPGLNSGCSQAFWQPLAPSCCYHLLSKVVQLSQDTEPVSGLSTVEALSHRCPLAGEKRANTRKGPASKQQQLFCLLSCIGGRGWGKINLEDSYVQKSEHFPEVI